MEGEKKKILDLKGRVVKNIDPTNPGAVNLTGTTAEVYWDGVDENGQPVKSGIYFYRVESESIVKNGKFVVVR